MSAFTGAFNGIDAVTDMTNKIKLRTMYIEVFLEESNKKAAPIISAR